MQLCTMNTNKPCHILLTPVQSRTAGAEFRPILRIVILTLTGRWTLPPPKDELVRVQICIVELV